MSVARFRVTLMAKSTPGYACSECGWTTVKWVGRCGECQAWGTVVEAGTQTGIQQRMVAVTVSGDNVAKPITEVPENGELQHWASGINEFDRVLGGGIVPGAAILLSGEPGVGKSTLLLEVASRAAKSGARVLYVSAEESVSQVRLRASRTGALNENLYLAAETDLSTIIGQIDAVSPSLLIVDSVQTVASSNIDGLAGGSSQVPRCSMWELPASKTPPRARPSSPVMLTRRSLRWRVTSRRILVESAR